MIVWMMVTIRLMMMMLGQELMYEEEKEDNDNDRDEGFNDHLNDQVREARSGKTCANSSGSSVGHCLLRRPSYALYSLPLTLPCHV